MRINADFSQVILIKPEDYKWVNSPNGLVRRMMLDRIGEEKARATSLVLFPQETTFPEHEHPLGEEILVLSGTFIEDGIRHFPNGWYLRNPHNTSHIPSSKEDTLIFVKLMQMSPQDTTTVQLNTHLESNWTQANGRAQCLLHQFGNEVTYLERLSQNQELQEKSSNGLEILVIEGELIFNHEVCSQGTWLRIPARDQHIIKGGNNGAVIYIKTGHLS
ncbi:MAG: cupin domain-containing protein [Pseudomonadota bacterium]|nr:cupin domain-containing protein [Pseudomonadota bacterium]